MEGTGHPSLQEVADKAARLAHSLRKGLKIKLPNDREVEVIQKELRRHYESLIFVDYEWSENRNVETDLWLRANHEVIQAYRKALQKLQNSTLAGGDGGGAKPVVETRKMGQAFNTFLQDAMGFYKTLFKGLVAQFGLAGDLKPVLNKLGITAEESSLAQDDSAALPTPEKKEKMLASLQRTLVCLGDLVRYRQKHVKTIRPREKSDFQLCLEYYNIAGLIDPTSGNPHNQLAIIATYQNDSFSAIYQYYRAISVKKGFPTAKDNLAIVLSKASNDDISLDQFNDSARFRFQYVKLHAILFLRQKTHRYDNLERRVLSDFATLLGQRGLSGEQIFKVIVIAIAVLQHVRLHRQTDEVMRMQSDAEQKINIEGRALYLLLQLIERMLKTVCLEIKAANLDTAKKVSTEKGQTPELSPVVRRLLPALRIASAWLKTNVNYIARAKSIDNLSNTTIWTHYGTFATALVKAYPRKQCGALDRPLAEDIDMRGFTPLKRTMQAATLAQSVSSVTRLNSDVHATDEQMMRIGDLEKDIALHVQTEGGPISYKNNVFVAEKIDKSSLLGASESRPRSIQQSIEIGKSSMRPVGSPSPNTSSIAKESAQDVLSSSPAHHPSFSLEGMVADLIDDEEQRPINGGEAAPSNIEGDSPNNEDEDDIIFSRKSGENGPSGALATSDKEAKDEKAPKMTSPRLPATVLSPDTTSNNAHNLFLNILNQGGSSNTEPQNISAKASSPFAWPTMATKPSSEAPTADWNQAAFANSGRYNRASQSPSNQKAFVTAKGIDTNK